MSPLWSVEPFFIASVCLPRDLIFWVISLVYLLTAEVHTPSDPSKHDQGTPQTGNELTAA